MVLLGIDRRWRHVASLFCIAAIRPLIVANKLRIGCDLSASYRYAFNESPGVPSSTSVTSGHLSKYQISTHHNSRHYNDLSKLGQIYLIVKM
jgi:hypothetical protein